VLVDLQEAREALARGFDTFWVVHAAYEVRSQPVDLEERRIVEHGQLRMVRGLCEELVIVPQGPVKHFYAPIMRPELPNALAKIEYGDIRAAMAFVQTYGLLGYAKFGRQEHPGEPLSWLWTHAETVHLCLRLSYFLQAGEPYALRQYLRSLRGPDPLSWQGQTSPVTFTACRDHTMHIGWSPRRRKVAEADDDARFIELARRMWRDLINENIVGIHYEIRDNNGQDSPGFVFKALCEMIYWHVMNPKRKHAMRQCANPQCRAPFWPKDARQTYCPPRVGQKESPCATSQRVAKHRRQQRSLR
jgi:hypothetical protein